MNAFIASPALDPRSPLAAVSIQSPFMAFDALFGQDGAVKAARDELAASAAQDERDRQAAARGGDNEAGEGRAKGEAADEPQVPKPA